MADSKSVAKNVLMLLAVFIVAFGGVYLGTRLRQQPAESTPISEELTSKLGDGAQFPEVDLYAEDSSLVRSADLLAGKPAVVLFLELGCPPCKIMTSKWQALQADGQLSGINLLGITFSPLREIRKYRLENQLTVPVYADSANVFMSSYNITNYPYMIALDRSGKVVMHSFDANEEIDPSHLKHLVGL
jgi:peroxiredoxin